MATSPALLDITGLSAAYQGAIVALEDVSLTVHTGEIHALIGSNGAGKTTTLRAVSALLKALRGAVTGGSITVDGQDIAGLSPATLIRLGIAPVLEGRHVFSSLTVEENLITGALGRGLSKRETTSGLAQVYALFPRLADKRRTRAGFLSGGEQQMAAIGRALMARPRLLILDEPSMGLAPIVTQAIFSALATLNQTEGLSILLAEQNAAIALSHAHRATLIETGRSVLTDDAQALARRPDIQSFYFGQTQAALHAVP